MRGLSKKILILLLLISLTLSLTGCIERLDLSKRAFVVGIGLDKGTEEKYRLTLQIANASGLGIGGAGTEVEEPVWVYATEGDTVFEAIREQLKNVNRKPFYGDTQIIVIGEELAKDGIKDILDILERDPETSITSTVLIARGMTAETVMHGKSTIESIPAMQLFEIVENQSGNAMIHKATLFDLLNDLNTESMNPTIGVIELVDETDEELYIRDFQVRNSAVFKGDRLVGYLDRDGNLGSMYILGNVEGLIANVPNPREEGKIVAIEEVRAIVKKQAKLDKNSNMVTIHVNVKAYGNIGGMQGVKDLTTQEAISALEKEAADKIKKQIQHAIYLSQKEFDSDFLGFGKTVRKQQKKYWKEFGPKWQDAFSNVPIIVDVDFKINRTGIIGPPTRVLQ